MNEPATFHCDTGHPDRLEAYREGACAALVVHEGKKAVQVNLPEHEAHRLMLWLAQHLCEVRRAAVDAPVNAPLPVPAPAWDPSKLNYRRVVHAAHYGNSVEAGGHDLEQWTYAQRERLPKREGIPQDAEYLSGTRLDGVQYWTYQRTAPWSEPYCDRCRPAEVNQATVDPASRELVAASWKVMGQAEATYEEPAGCHRSQPCCRQAGQRDRKAAQACPEDCSCHD